MFLQLLSACSGGGSSDGSSMRVLPQIRSGDSRSQPLPVARELGGRRLLYVTSADPYFFNAYRLPLRSGETPKIRKTGINEPVPIANDSTDLYVGSFSDGTIFTYALPLVPTFGLAESATTLATPSYIAPFARTRSRGAIDAALPSSSGGVPSGLGNLSGLAADGESLYVAGAGRRDEKVLEYRLPFVIGEKPSGSITGFSMFDFLGIAVRNKTLYVASTLNGTVGAYALPLKFNGRPEYTITTVPQSDGASGVAINGNGTRLYVSLYSVGVVDEFKLPYQPGEKPKVLNVEMETGGCPYGIAVGGDHLFVTAGDIYAFRLPLVPSSGPDAVVPFSDGFAAGVTAGPSAQRMEP